jgi:hypothetical protein
MTMESSEAPVFKPENTTVKFAPLCVTVVTVPACAELAVAVTSTAPLDAVPVVNGTFEVRTKVALAIPVFKPRFVNPIVIGFNCSVVPSTLTKPTALGVRVDSVATCALAVPANTRPTAANVKNIFRKSSISLVLLLVNFLFESVEVLNNLSLNYNECLCTSGNFSVSGAENLIKTSLPKRVELAVHPDRRELYM